MSRRSRLIISAPFAVSPYSWNIKKKEQKSIEKVLEFFYIDHDLSTFVSQANFKGIIVCSGHSSDLRYWSSSLKEASVCEDKTRYLTLF